MKLYIADYLAETTHLDAAGHGAYLLLIMAMWRAGGKLPRDEAKLARVAQCTPDQWAAVRDDVMAFFKVTGGTIKHNRVTKEIAKYDAVIDGAKAAGKASAFKKASKFRDKTPNERCENVERKSNQPKPEPEPEIEDTEANASVLIDLAPKAGQSTSLAKPAALGFDEFWTAYPRKVGKDAALKAYAAAIRRAGGHDPPGEILAGLIRAKPGWTDPQFIPHPATWLNQGRWQDEAPPIPSEPVRLDRVRATSQDRFDRRQLAHAADFAGAQLAAELRAQRR